MNSLGTTSGNRGSKPSHLGAGIKLGGAIVLAVIFCGLLAGPALAKHHDRHHEHWHGHVPYNPAPTYYYQPPPNYYYTPEPYAYYPEPAPPPPGINLFFGLR